MGGVNDDGLSLKFWGVRGSLPVQGPEFDEFGGNSPCVEVRCGGRLFIVDGGTGLAKLGTDLGDAPPAEIDILLSHLHLDHVSGLPFFKPALMPGRVVRIYCGNLRGLSAEQALDRLFSPPLFPITLSQLPSCVQHKGFKAGADLDLGQAVIVRTIPLNHPGGATGYRFDHRGRAICYISDIEHSDPWPPPDLTEFIRGADLMIYDGMFSETEYIRCHGWGHSTWQKGVALAQAGGVEQLAIFHLHPQHDDAYLNKVEIEIKRIMPGAFVAHEGQSLSFPPVA